jgi:hypothetical protein
MRQILTPDQRVRLKAIQQRRDGRNRQSPSGSDRSGGGRNDGPSGDPKRIPEL